MRTTLIFVLFFLSMLATLAGCSDVSGAIAQSTEWRNKAHTIQTGLDEQIAIMQTRRELVPDGSPQAAQIDTALALAQSQSRALSAAITQADLVIAEAENPSDTLTQTARGISAWVPAPVQGPLVLGAALIATLARSRQLKSSAASIIRSINHVMDRDDQFKMLFEQHADTIRTIQTPTARRLVDRAKPKG